MADDEGGPRCFEGRGALVEKEVQRCRACSDRMWQDRLQPAHEET